MYPSIAPPASPDPGKRRGRPRLLAVFLGGLLLSGLIASGCAAPPPPKPKEPPRPPPEVVLSWARFKVGSHQGHIKAVAGPTGAIHWVYSSDWDLLGYFTPMGETFRAHTRKPPEFLGRYDKDDSLRALHGINELTVAVEHFPMEDPITLEDLEKAGYVSPRPEEDVQPEEEEEGS